MWLNIRVVEKNIIIAGFFRLIMIIAWFFSHETKNSDIKLSEPNL